MRNPFASRRAGEIDLAALQNQLAEAQSNLTISRAANTILEAQLDREKTRSRLARDIDVQLETKDLTNPEARIADLLSTEKKVELIHRVLSGSLREPVEATLRRIGMAMGLNDCNLDAVVKRAEALQSLAPLRDRVKEFFLSVEGRDIKFEFPEDADAYEDTRRLVLK